MRKWFGRAILNERHSHYGPRCAFPAQRDLSALKIRQQGAWSSGDYAIVGTTLQIVGETLCEFQKKLTTEGILP